MEARWIFQTNKQKLQKPCLFSSNNFFFASSSTAGWCWYRDLLSLSLVPTALLRLQPGSIGAAVTAVLLKTNSERWREKYRHKEQWGNQTRDVKCCLCAEKQPCDWASPRVCINPGGELLGGPLPTWLTCVPKRNWPINQVGKSAVSILCRGAEERNR